MRIVRSDGACYLQVFVDVPWDVASKRNRGRVEDRRVPDDVVLDMHERFERPRPEKHAWERNTIVVKGNHVEWMHDAEEHAQVCQRTYRALLEAWEHASPPPMSVAERKDMQERSRKGNLESKAHAFDLRARKIVSETLQEVSPEDRRDLALSLANAKRELLAEVEDEGWDAIGVERRLSRFRDTCKRVLSQQLHGSGQ